VRDGHVSKDRKGQPCIATSDGTSNDLSGSRSIAGRLHQQFQAVGTTAYLDGLCLGWCSVFYKALVRNQLSTLLRL
jgi:hypothetical protein